MAVQIRRWTGDDGSPSKTNVTSINSRLNAEDAHTTAGTDNPILVPAAGTNYSFWAHFRLYYDGTGSGTINNIKWFTDGANGLGTGVGLNVATATYYVQATGDVGETGDQLTEAAHGGLNDTPANAFARTSGSPLTVDGSVTDPENEDFGDFVVLQTTVGPTASAGATPSETMTFRYDTTIA